MRAEFWHERWATNDIGFHEAEPNPLLKKYITRLKLQAGSRVFLPLCGKTLDIHWLLSEGYSIAGAELNEQAVQQLFAELGLQAVVSIEGPLIHYRAANIDIWVGDIFDLNQKALGPVDAIYDRAALVALPDEVRKRYTQHLMDITGQARQLLIVFDYDQSKMDGPPFSIPATEITEHYGEVYRGQLLESVAVKGGLKGQCTAQEKIWLLDF